MSGLSGCDWENQVICDVVDQARAASQTALSHLQRSWGIEGLPFRKLLAHLTDPCLQKG